MKRLLWILVAGASLAACRDSPQRQTDSLPSRTSTTSEPPPLETVTMEEKEIVTLKEQPGRKRQPVGVPCPWAKIWESAGPRPLPVGGMIRPPKKLVDVAPILPYRKTATEGTPVLEIIIGTDGTVLEVQVLQSFEPPWPEGDAALMDAIKKWKYQPTTADGKPITICSKITLSVDWTEFSRDP